MFLRGLHSSCIHNHKFIIIGDEGKRKKKKKAKDKNAPKRAMSAYFLWLNANRNALKEKNPGASITELSKKAGEEWKNLFAFVHK